MEYKYGYFDNLGNAKTDIMFQKRPEWAVASISKYDSAFLIGMLKELKPTKVLEVGVASGWGSCLILDTLNESKLSYEFYGVDISERFFYNSNYRTGSAVQEYFNNDTPSNTLYLEKTISEVIEKIGFGIDFAFIDAHHMHPWATLDLIVILPFIKKDSYILLHDIGLSKKEDQYFLNRGPKYLFEGWVFDKIHSIQDFPMIGAIKVDDNVEKMLTSILDILYTPWELSVSQKVLNNILGIIKKYYGDEWYHKFRSVIELKNYHINLLEKFGK